MSPTGSEHTAPDLDLDRMDSNVGAFLPLFVLYAERGCEGGWLRVGCELILRAPLEQSSTSETASSARPLFSSDLFVRHIGDFPARRGPRASVGESGPRTKEHGSHRDCH